MVEIDFGQVYIGVSFPFSHHFQRRLSEEVTALVEPSALFVKKYGADFHLVFNVSAKQELQENEVRGPTVFRKTKDVEYTVFLPFDPIMRDPEPPRAALEFLLKGACEVFERLEIDTTKLLKHRDALIEEICSDPIMLAAPSWNEADDRSPVRAAFEAFFRRGRGA